ncbi:uncharacterized protein BXZ73DRAFT_87071 [Epithele typhae]|uniref:uncharacterized protein n=1 Tax=Epithele typhae TaxID=378194 RepID=UPI0020079150|nr:uncharacterized protein BXZ73DRAFT_87071 [Epithele typhae]KAH9944112.1 hypothetical protein BXZ73DRAFT_87071 [Epithele typhae]
MDYFDLNLPAPTDVQDPGNQDDIPTVPEAAQNVSTTPDVAQVHTPLDHPNILPISTAFHPVLSINGQAPNFVFIASDNVRFYVHTHHILAVSMNRMGMLLPNDVPASTLGPRPSAQLPHPSEVVNVMLHIIYGLQCLQYAPTLETTEAALKALHFQYGVSIQVHAAPHLPLYQLILSYAPFRPLEAYAVAAHYALEELAVATSSHLLAYDLSRMPDDTAQKMGPIYLKRLLGLHQSRLAALRNILFRPPREHGPAVGCSTEQRQQLTRAWALAVAQLVWEVLPSVSTNALQSLLEPIGLAFSCPHCAVALQGRVREVVYEWSAVKVPRISCGRQTGSNRSILAPLA